MSDDRKEFEAEIKKWNDALEYKLSYLRAQDEADRWGLLLPIARWLGWASKEARP